MTVRRTWRGQRRLLVGGVVAVVAAVVLTGCEDAPSADRSAPTSTNARPKPDPIVFGESLWQRSGDLRPVRTAQGVQLRDGVLLTWETEEGIRLIDVRTGQPRWKADEFQPLPGTDLEFVPHDGIRAALVRQDDGIGVLVTYDTDGCERGLASLSAQDGHVLWRTEIIPANGCDMEHYRIAQLWAADDTTALVSVTPDSLDTFDASDVRTVAVDVRTGERKWEWTGMWPYAVVGDVALFSTTQPWDPYAPTYGYATNIIEPGTMTALDLSTGEPKWRAEDQYPVTRQLAVAGDVVAVTTADAAENTAGNAGDNEAVRVLDAASGRELAVLSDADTRPFSCDTDARELIACVDEGGDELVVFRVEDRAAATMPLEREVSGVAAVAGRWIAGEDMSAIVDLGGNIVDDEPPGTLVAIADDVAIVRHADGIEAYRLER